MSESWADEGGDTDDVADWMARRQQAVADRDANLAAGRDTWAASTATGQNLQAANPDDVRALGAQAQAQPQAPDAGSQAQDAAAAAPPQIKRGNKGILSDDTMARILFGELRSYSGPGTMQAIVNNAHALINADETYGSDRSRYASSIDPVMVIPPAEAAAFRRMQDGLAIAKAQRAQGIDPTNGALHFGFQTSDTKARWLGQYPIRTQVGPLHNSFPSRSVPSSTAWANTYQD